MGNLSQLIFLLKKYMLISSNSDVPKLSLVRGQP